MDGIAAASRRFGFLWVFWESSTFLRPEVTLPPWLSCAKTASMPPALPAEAGNGAAGEGGGGADGAAGAAGGGGAADLLKVEMS